MDDQLIRDWAARVVGQVTSFSLGRIDSLWTQRYAMAIDDLDPVYFDDEAAKKRGLLGIIAPPNYLTTIRTAPQAGPSEEELLADGTSIQTKPEIPGLQVMGGGQSIEFFSPVYCGEEISCDKQVKSITKRASKNGELVVLEEEFLYRNSLDQPKIILINRLLYRMVRQDVGNE
jgi:acyl dehydratase